VSSLWLLAAFSLVGWLIVNLDTAGWVLVVVTIGLMIFELTRRPAQSERDKRRMKSNRPPDEPSG
jgi:hypothetical protein